MAFTKEEWQEFYQRNPDFPATDFMCRELEKRAKEKGCSLDEAWEEMKEERKSYQE